MNTAPSAHRRRLAAPADGDSGRWRARRLSAALACASAAAALQSRSVNFVTPSSTALLNARAKGVPLEAVASTDYGVSLQLLVSNNWIKSHGLSSNQPLNTVMKKMTGAKVGVLSTTDLDYDHYLEQQAGIDPNQLTYIKIGSQSAALAGLEHGEIDAFLLSPPSGYFAQSQGGATVITTLHQVPELANMAYDVLVVDSDWAKSHAGHGARADGRPSAGSRCRRSARRS